MPSSTFVPRRERDQARGRRAYDAQRAVGADVMTAAMAQIDAVFNRAQWAPNEIKRHAEIMLRRGAGDMEVRARYYSLAERVWAEIGSEPTIDDAIWALGRFLAEWDDQERTRYRERGWSRSQFPAELMREARLMLRWLRARGLGEAFPQIFEIATTPLRMPVPRLIVLPGHKDRR